MGGGRQRKYIQIWNTIIPIEFSEFIILNGLTNDFRMMR